MGTETLIQAAVRYAAKPNARVFPLVKRMTNDNIVYIYRNTLGFTKQVKGRHGCWDAVEQLDANGRHMWTELFGRGRNKVKITTIEDGIKEYNMHVDLGSSSTNILAHISPNGEAIARVQNGQVLGKEETQKVVRYMTSNAQNAPNLGEIVNIAGSEYDKAVLNQIRQACKPSIGHKFNINF